MTSRKEYGAGLDRSSDRSTNLSGFLAILARYKWSLLAAPLAGLALAMMVLSTLQPVYTASGAVFVDPRSRKIVTDEIIQGGFGSDASLVESQVSIIVSDSVLSRVVETENLQDDTEFASEAQTGWLAQIKDMIRGPRPVSDLKTQALESLARIVRVKRPAKSYVLEVEASTTSPAKSARIVNAVLAAYIEDQTSAKSDEAKRANTLIDARLNELRQRVRAAEERLDSFKRENRIVVSEGGIVTEQQLGKLNIELATARSVSAEAKARFEQAQAAIRAGDPDNLPDAIKSALIQKLREQYSQVARREAALSAQLQGRHPVLIDIRSQVKELKAQIAAELKRVAAGARNELQIASAREREILKAIETTKTEVNRSNTAQIRMRELEQDLSSSREILGAFLARAKETLEQANLSAPEARIITPAGVPTRASFPSPMLILALGLLAGLGAGIARALLGDAVNPVAAPRPPVSGHSGTPPRATLPVIAVPSLAGRLRGRLGSLRGKSGTTDFADILAVAGDPSGGGSPRYRQAILRLLGSLSADPQRERAHIVLVAGARRGAGASSTALALAYTAALGGERTLLVDATSTDADLSAIFAPSVDPGTPVVLDNRDDLARITTRDVRSGLAFLPIALADIRRLKLAQRRRLAAGLGALARSYDLLFIDAGALLDDEAASALLPLADQILFVADAGKTQESELAEIERLVAAHTDQAIDLVVNKAPVSA